MTTSSFLKVPVRGGLAARLLAERKWRSGFGNGGWVVEAQKLSGRGGHLTLSRLPIGSDAQWRNRGTEASDPDPFRTRNGRTVTLPPGGRVSSAMVRGDQEVGSARVFRVGFHEFPQQPEIMIVAVRRVQVLVVSPFMSPVVGFPQADKQHAWPLVFQGTKSSLEGEVIIADSVPHAGHVGRGLIQLLNDQAVIDRVIISEWKGLPAGINGNAAAGTIQNEREDIPRTIGLYLTWETVLAM